MAAAGAAHCPGRRSGCGALLAAAAALSSTCGASAQKVVGLTAADFESSMQQGVWFVKFFEPWCVYCQRLAPIWEQLGKRAASANWPLVIAEADCKANIAMSQRCHQIGIKAFPTLLLIRDGAPQRRYLGPASVASFENWLKIYNALTPAGTTNAGHSPSVHPPMTPLAKKPGLEEERVAITTRNHTLVARISVGSPPQTLRCLVYSGSSHFWVPSARCGTCQCENSFAADKSSSFRPDMMRTPQGMQPRPVLLAYGSGTGSIHGFFVRDTLSFGTAQVENQSFVIAESAAMPPHRSWDGVCGLGWQADGEDPPLYARLQQQGRRALFAMVPTAEGEAQMVVGQVPHKAIKKGTLVWAKAEPLEPGVSGQQPARRSWITSGGLAVHRNKPVATRFLVDTGTNLALLAPERHYIGIVDSLLPKGVARHLCGESAIGPFVACDCAILQEKGSLPLRVYLGGRAFQLSFADLFMRLPREDGSTEDHCILLIQPNSMGLPGRPAQGAQSQMAIAAQDVWVLGGVFLERFVTLFDFDQEQLGFAEPTVKLGAPMKQCVNCWEELGSRASPDQHRAGLLGLDARWGATALAATAVAATAAAALGWRACRLDRLNGYSRAERLVTASAAEGEA